MRQQQQQPEQQQIGGEIPAFVGATRQRGHGIGSVLAGLFRRVLPFLRANARNFGVNAIKTGLHVADDVMQGQKFTDSFKRRVPEGIKTAAQNINWQTGDGLSAEHRSSNNSRNNNNYINNKRSRSTSSEQPRQQESVKKKNKKKKKKSRQWRTFSDIFGH